MDAFKGTSDIQLLLEFA